MIRMSKSVGSNDLSMRMSMDLSEFEQGFVDAKKSFKQNMAQLRTMKNDIKLKMDIDIARLGPAATETQKLAVRERYLTQQMNAQKATVALLNEQYRNMALAKGEGDKASKKLQTSLLYEQRALANMNNEMQRIKQSGSISGIRNLFGNGNLQNMTVSGLMNGLGDIKYQLLGATAAGAALYGVMGSIKSAANAGEGIKEFSEMLGTSTKDAADLMKILKLGQVDVGAFAGIMTRLDKSLLTAGDKGNDLTNTLKEFDVNLKDSTGNLLPLNEQLDALAAGYQKAISQGRGQEFVSQVLGARGRELAGVLRDINELRADAAKLPSSIIDPEEAKRVNREFRVLDMQLAGLKNTIGGALLPVVNELLPKITDAGKGIGDFVKENKEGTVAVVEAATGFFGMKTALNGMELLFAAPIPPMAKFILLLTAVGKAVDDYTASVEKAESKKFTGRDVDSLNATVRYNESTGTYQKKVLLDAPGNETLMPDVKSALRGEQVAWKDLSAEEEKTRKEQVAAAEEAKKGKEDIVAATQEETKSEKEYQEQLKKEKEIQKANLDSLIETYKLTHNELANQILDLNLKANMLRQKGVEEQNIVAYTEAMKAKIIDDFTDNTIAKIGEAYESSLQNRLAAIEKEKKAWQQKGVDEVAATQWAEEQKRDAGRKAALDILKNRKKEFDEYRQALKESQGYTIGHGIDSEGNQVNFKYKNENAMTDFYKKQTAAFQKKYNIDPNDLPSMADIRGFLNMDKLVESHAFAGSDLNSILAMPDLTRLGEKGPMYSIQAPITVNIDQPIVRDNGDITSLADQVADKIQPAIEQALGGQGNGY